MASASLFVSPGLRATDAAEAKRRYHGESERDDFLDERKIAEVVAVLVRDHGLRVESEDDVEDGSPRGFDLEGPEDAPFPDVRVDASGVGISMFPSSPDAESRRRLLTAGLDVARTCSRLLDGAVYAAELEAMVDPADPELAREIDATFSRAGVDMGPKVRKGQFVIFLFVLGPVVLLQVLRRYVHGFPLFLAVFGTMAALAFFLAWWVRRPARAALPITGGPPPSRDARPTGGFDNRPIKPG